MTVPDRMADKLKSRTAPTKGTPRPAGATQEPVRSAAAPSAIQHLQSTAGNRATVSRLATEHAVPTQAVPKPALPTHADPKPTVRRVMEKEFIKDPSAFMAANQLLVAFDQGVQLTYKLAAGDLTAIKTRQEQLSAAELIKVRERRGKAERENKVDPDDDYGLSVAKAMKNEASITTKGNNYLTQLMEQAMTHAKCSHFTLASRAVGSGLFSRGRTQYIVTPVLETLTRSIGEDVTTTGPDGTQISLLRALESLKRVQPYDALIEAAFIPYETNPNLVTADHAADLSTTGPKIAFTASMNGCSLAVKRKSETELTVWHYPSPDSNEARWETFKDENDVGQTFDWEQYNGLTDAERYRQHKNHVTTTVMVRDEHGWKIQSQQNVGPEGGDQRTELLKVGKLAEARVDIGQEAEIEVRGGEAVVEAVH